ncbi:sensor histidine kinase [Streptomyces sp. BE303]|uniref:sensor histidine kinase n=1 Tax=Streptomyces sp. BE303 TaxID=3002528 RepID=UPI002E7794CA|nr:ATP-binding protein [Streptomyces sp. BE303]MED7950725.1 ATP-binding protein [Streptomyces sp. BE303]
MPTLRPRARLLHTIGTELISSETVAVVELVKNAYDADASCVVLSFTGELQQGDGQLSVLDDGSGMTSETVAGVWLEIATPYRSQTRTTRRGRRVLGEKGVGRFAAARLADSMTLISRPEAGGPQVVVDVDWQLFRNPEAYLDEISISVAEQPPTDYASDGRVASLWRRSDLDPKDHGTLMLLNGLTRAWGEPDIVALRRDLSRLITPIGQDGNRDFEIVLDLPPEFDHLAGSIDPPDELMNPPYRLTGMVAANGTADLQISLPDQDAQHVRVELDRNHEHRDELGVLACGPFSIDLRAYDRDRDSIAQLISDGSLSLSTKGFRDLLNQRAGVSVYRDGFRVLPFGEKGDDWLTLDSRRVNSPAMRLSNSQVIGTVSIAAEANPGLRDQTNREGLLQGPAYDALRSVAVEIIAELETRRFELKRRNSSPDLPKGHGLFDDLNLDDISEAVRRSHPNDKALAAVVANAERRISVGVGRVREVLSRYQSLATLGMLVNQVVHDGQSSVGRIRRVTRDAGALLNQAPECDVRDQARGLVDAADRQGDYLALLFKRIAPFGGRRRGRPKKVGVFETLRTAVDVLQSRIEKVGALVTVSGTDENVTIDPAELQEVVINLLDNSLYWVGQVPQGSRHIDLKVERLDDGSLTLVVDDSGPGVPDEIRESIFQPYFSSKPEGTGLGLSIVGERVGDAYGGTLELVESELGGAAFCVTFNRRV